MGRRGAGWVKVKPRITVDLVVLAAEWGHGRRQGLLSNLHLGARDPDGEHGPPGGFVMLGKTFKGLTDAMLAWQTEHLRGLAERSTGHVVHVRPELVVEIAFDGVQDSTRYPAGMALRFARRVLALRPASLRRRRTRSRPSGRPGRAPRLSRGRAPGQAASLRRRGSRRARRGPARRKRGKPASGRQRALGGGRRCGSAWAGPARDPTGDAGLHTTRRQEHHASTSKTMLG